MEKGKSIVVSFVSDTAKASRDVDAYANRIDKARTRISSKAWSFGADPSLKESLWKRPKGWGMAEPSIAKEKVFKQPKGWGFGTDPSMSRESLWKRPKGWDVSPAWKTPTGERNIPATFPKRQFQIDRDIESMGKSMTNQWSKAFGSFGMQGTKKIETGGMKTPLIDVTRASNSLNKAGEKIAKKVGFFSKAMGSVDNKLMRFASSLGVVDPNITRLISGLGQFGTVVGLATAALIGFKAFLEKTFEMGNLVEGALIQMKVITGDTQKAHGLLKEAMRESLVTQFSPAQMLAATQMAIQYGIKPYEAGAHGLKKDQTTMKLISAMGSFRDIHGKALGPERAIYAIARGDRRLLRPYGRDVSSAYEEAKLSGKTGSAKFVDTFIKKLGEIPYLMNMAEEQSNSVVGLWSTIAGFAEEAWFAISGAGEKKGVITFWSQVKDIMKDIRDGGIAFMSYISAPLTEFGTYVGAHFKFIWDMLKEIWGMIGPIIIPAFKAIVQVLRAIWSTIRFIFNITVQFARLLKEITLMPGRILNAIFGLGGGVKSLLDELSEFVTGLQITFMFFEIMVRGVVDSIAKAIDNMISNIREVIASLGEELDEFAAKHPTIFKIIDAAQNITTDTVMGALPVVGNIYNANKINEQREKFEAGKLLRTEELTVKERLQIISPMTEAETNQENREKKYRQREKEKGSVMFPEQVPAKYGNVYNTTNNIRNYMTEQTPKKGMKSQTGGIIDVLNLEQQYGTK